MKVQPRKLREKDRIRYIDALYTAAGSLQGRREMKAFLHDLLTESERVMLGRRIVIARMLLSGYNYDEIVEELNVGCDTVVRINRWLDEEHPGYRKAIEGMERTMAARRGDPSRMLAAMKKKFPLHFLLMPRPRVR